ncbi:MAG: SCP2 sterol-binding domain-containing protein [Gammaproteobacteria bacterium]|nr:SCP2 sterol-binding domain-containing protein [Gammaproteobacteria bacterium]
MAAPALLCAALEVALNRYLRLEPSALAQCAQMAEQRIALRVDGLDWHFVLQPHAGGVQVMAGGEPPAAVTVSGSPARLLREAWRVAEGEGGLPQGLQVEGEVEVLARFNRILAGVGFDPEEMVAKLTGDAAAHRVTELARGLLGWTRRAAATLSLDAAEYLREETYDLVHRADVEKWMDEVDAVRERADRLEARLRLLEQRANPQSPTAKDEQ